MDKYLVEIVVDVYLKLLKFFVFVELFLDYVCQLDDGLYRVVDIFFEVCFFMFVVNFVIISFFVVFLGFECK